MTGTDLPGDAVPPIDSGPLPPVQGPLKPSKLACAVPPATKATVPPTSNEALQMPLVTPAGLDGDTTRIYTTHLLLFNGIRLAVGSGITWDILACESEGVQGNDDVAYSKVYIRPYPVRTDQIVRRRGKCV